MTPSKFSPKKYSTGSFRLAFKSIKVSLPLMASGPARPTSSMTTSYPFCSRDRAKWTPLAPEPTITTLSISRQPRHAEFRTPAQHQIQRENQQNGHCTQQRKAQEPLNRSQQERGD